MSILTTTQALQIGIESIEIRDDIPPKTKQLTIELLQSLEKADWHKGWDEESIIKALQDYKERTGIAPTVTSLKEYGMPKSVTIRSYFHMSPSLFLKRLFPENQKMRHVNPQLSNPFGFKAEADWLNCFIEQFNKHKAEGMSSRKYNILRDQDTPTWDTIARHCGLSTWTSLMEKAGVEYPNKTKTAQSLFIANATSPTIERLEAINKQREIFNTELYDILTEKNKKKNKGL